MSSQQAEILPNQSPKLSISAEQFALGAIAVYVLNFTIFLLTIISLPIGLFTVGYYSSEKNAFDPPSLIYFIYFAFFVLTAFLAFIVVKICFWGARSIFRAKISSMIIFMILLLTWQGALWTYNGSIFLDLAITSLLTGLIIWKRTFAQLARRDR